ncbi:MAG TPA: peptidoglycan-binding domain-containing protein [Candidatus Binatia bacterium]
MSKSKVLMSLVLGGAVALATGPVWSQSSPSKTKPGEEQNLPPGATPRGNTGDPMSAQSTSPSTSSRTPETHVGTDQNLPPVGSMQKGNTGQPMSAQSGQPAAGDREDRIPTKPGEAQNIPPTAEQKGTLRLSADEMASVNRALASKGYKPGPAGSTMDAKTQEAIRAFQKDNNLPITGTIDQRTADKLGVTLKTKNQPSTK